VEEKQHREGGVEGKERTGKRRTGKREGKNEEKGINTSGFSFFFLLFKKGMEFIS
jgi:hypothetical protein